LNRLGLLPTEKSEEFKIAITNQLYDGYRLFLKQTNSYNPAEIYAINKQLSDQNNSGYEASYTGNKLQEIFPKHI